MDSILIVPQALAAAFLTCPLLAIPARLPQLPQPLQVNKAKACECVNVWTFEGGVLIRHPFLPHQAWALPLQLVLLP